jgi:hypothetical protein
MLLTIFLIGCNNADENSSDLTVELPQISLMSGTTMLLKENISDIEAIKSQNNTLSFAYYVANKLTKEGNNRWYISQINGRFAGYVFSLMPIVNEHAGWGEVSSNGASVDISQNNITIGYIDDNPTYEYKDWGTGITQVDSIIQEDIELIRDSTVQVKWWFFKASNDSWYIVNEKAIYKFGSIDGAYDWQKIDMTNLSIEFFIENGLKKMRLVDNDTESLPQLNLNHKSETQEVKKRTGCNFNDIYENMFSSDKKEEDYIRAICQAGIMQGDEVQTYNFEPFSDVSRYTVARVTSLVYNYEEVNKFCSQSKYDNNEEYCYTDYAKEKGFNIKPIMGTLKKYELYKYLVNLFWNKTVSDKFEAWHFLKDKGVLIKAPLSSEPASQLYIMDFMETKLLRWELATLVMRCSRISKEEQPSFSGGELPYSIVPDDKEITLVELEQLIDCMLLGESEENFEVFMNRCLADNLWNAGTDIKEETFFIPKNSLPQTVNIQETDINELPNIVVDTATKNIGKQSPYTDGKNTIDTRLITTVYGQDVKYDSAKDMCNDYEAQGKLQEGLPTDRDLKGSIVCYKDNTPGTNGKGHVAIISDSKGAKEIGVQDIKNGVMERPTDKENIKGVIAPTDVNLPNYN